MNIDAKTQKFGIIGYPLGHTYSPAMHNAAFDAMGINAVYLVFQTKNLLQLKHSLKQLQVQGLSVTIPYKVRIRNLVDKIDPLALQIGSVNTVVQNKEGLFEGYNTDGLGAVHAIEESGFDLRKKKVLIIGSGGSARAIAFAILKKNPERIGFLARNKKVALQLARTLRIEKQAVQYELIHYPGGATARRIQRKAAKKAASTPRKKRFNMIEQSVLETTGQLADYDLVINTTPLGMAGYSTESPLAKEFLHKHQVLFDIVYNPSLTPLLKAAKAKKLEIIYGYKMLLYQGALQFKLFTGEDAPIEVMQRVLKKELQKK